MCWACLSESRKARLPAPSQPVPPLPVLISSAPGSLVFPSRSLTRQPLTTLPRAYEDLVRRKFALPVPVMGLSQRNP